MRKLLFTLFIVILLVSVSSCSSVETIAPVSTAEEMIALIDNMGEATLENEFVIENTYVVYTQLDASEKAKVTNYDVLEQARADIVRNFYTEQKDGERIDRSKILIGTYCFYTKTEERFQWLVEAGIDFVVGIPNNTEVLDLCLEYGIGAFLSYLPGWYGGDGSNSGQLAQNRPSGVYDSYAESFVDHPAIWTMDVGDEPSAEDFPHYGLLIEEAKELFPGKLIYLNLYPNYANSDQLGVGTYQEHIQAYIDNVDTDYISFDFYSIDEHAARTRNVDYFMIRHMDNLRIVANACRETGADLWTVMQAGASSRDREASLSREMLNAQVYSALAFGSQVINWACWEDGWFNEGGNIIHPDGHKNPVFDRLAVVNHEIKNLSPVYMKYTNTDTAFINDISTVKKYVGYEFTDYDDNVLDQDVFLDLTVKVPDEQIVAGTFKKNAGEGSAILFANMSDFFGRGDTELGTEISFTLADKNAVVFIYYPEGAYELTPTDGVYSFFLKRTDGAFVTVEYPGK